MNASVKGEPLLIKPKVNLKPLAAMIVTWRLRALQRLAIWGIREQSILVVLAAAVGLTTGWATWLFEQTVLFFHRGIYTPLVLTSHATTQPALYLLLPLIPAAGGVLLMTWRRLWGREREKLHGLSGLLHALSRGTGKLKTSLGLTTLVGSSITIGTGGSAGPEAPIAVIGASVGSIVGNSAGISRRNLPILIGCGAAAGISAVFGAPIAGLIFSLEVLLRDFSAKTLIPIVISSVISTTMYVGLSGGGNLHGLFQMPSSGPRLVFTFHELPWYLLLGILCGLLSVAFTRFYMLVEDAAERWSEKINSFWMPAIGAGLSGVCGIALLVLFHNNSFLKLRFSQGYIPIFGGGYPTILRMIDPTWYTGAHVIGGRVAELTLAFLLTICVLKILATSFTLAPGGSGGVFAPALFIGAAGGGAVGVMLHTYLPSANPSTYALVGMGAMLAAVIQAPLTAIMLLFELTRNYAVMLPIMLAAVAATIIQQVLVGESLYTLPLRRLGVRLGSAVGMSALQRVGVDQLQLIPAATARPDETFSAILQRSHTDKIDDFVVLDARGAYLGLLTINDLKTVLLEPEAAPLLLAAEVLRSDVTPLYFHDTLEAALAMFSKFEVAHMAVLDDAIVPGKAPALLGMLSRAELMRRYYRELG